MEINKKYRLNNIQHIINKTHNSGGGKIILPNDEYVQDSDIILYADVDLVGQNKRVNRWFDLIFWVVIGSALLYFGVYYLIYLIK